MQKTKIDWCDSTWNPVTGCLHDCEYCYARGIVKRFGSGNPIIEGDVRKIEFPELFIPESRISKSGYEIQNPYPYGFIPAFYRYLLDRPLKWKKPRNIFVVSMGDLFGKWVPDEWIRAVFKACEAAPQHRYLFLTKNPARYLELAQNGMLPLNKNFWYGTTATTDDVDIFFSGQHNTFISIEPILNVFDCQRIDDGLFCHHNWVIIGAETGNRKDKVIPKREWIESIVEQCKTAGVPVFMKSSLKKIWGEPLMQQYPWEENK